MSIYQKGAWGSPRTQGQPLTTAEIAKLREAFDAGRRAEDIACEIDLSPRNAKKYYARFRGNIPVSRGRPSGEIKKKLIAAQPVKPPKSRFYTSNFEL